VPYRLMAYLVKFLSLLIELPGRLLVFNLSTPEVGKEELDVPYDHVNRRKQSLDVFVPKGAPPYPILIYIHGSGFHAMDKKSFRRICRWFADKGYLMFNVNYRLAPECGFPEQVTDVARAVRWGYDHASEYGGDNSRIFLGGDSAGAYFSSMYAAALNEPGLLDSLSMQEGIRPQSIKGLLLFYGGYDFDTVVKTRFPFIGTMVRGYLGEEDDGYRHRVELASPTRHVGRDYPPAYITVGSWDPLYSESVLFDRVLIESGVPHRTHIFPKRYLDGFHGFLCVPFSKCSQIALEEAAEFMDGLK